MERLSQFFKTMSTVVMLESDGRYHSTKTSTWALANIKPDYSWLSIKVQPLDKATAQFL